MSEVIWPGQVGLTDRVLTDAALTDTALDRIVTGLGEQGWVVCPDMLAPALWQLLLQRARGLDSYSVAGIGRGGDFQANSRIRSDQIHWLEPADPVDGLWLQVMEQLRTAINRRLFLGLFEFESHYARYAPGQFYQRHLDAFKDQGNRVVSVVCYLNPDWQTPDGGEFVLYPEGVADGLRFLPQAGTLAVFLSEEFPHEVLPAARERFSIAGWFRVNASAGGRIDPAS